MPGFTAVSRPTSRQLVRGCRRSTSARKFRIGYKPEAAARCTSLRRKTLADASGWYGDDPFPSACRLILDTGAEVTLLPRGAIERHLTIEINTKAFFEGNRKCTSPD